MSDVWGYLEDGKFVPLPRVPMERAGLGPPPFFVNLPDGRARFVICEPDVTLPNVTTTEGS